MIRERWHMTLWKLETLNYNVIKHNILLSNLTSAAYISNANASRIHLNAYASFGATGFIWLLTS